MKMPILWQQTTKLMHNIYCYMIKCFCFFFVLILVNTDPSLGYQRTPLISQPTVLS